MATFSCRKCSLLFPSYAVCYAHLLDTPAHATDRAAATAEAGRRGLRSAIEGMMTIMLPADAALSRSTISAGRAAIEDQASPIPRPVCPAQSFFSARVSLRGMHRYTAQPAPAALRASYDLLLRLPLAGPAPTFVTLVNAVTAEFDAKAGLGVPVVWWGLLGQSMVANVWTAGFVVKRMQVRSDGGVRRMLQVALVKELHALVLGGEEEEEG